MNHLLGRCITRIRPMTEDEEARLGILALHPDWVPQDVIQLDDTSILFIYDGVLHHHKD